MNYCEFDDTSTTNVEMFIFITLLCAALASPLIFFFDRLLSKLYVDLESDPSFKDDLLEAELASRQAKKKKEEYKRKRNELKAQLKKQGLNKQEIKGKGRLRLVFFASFYSEFDDDYTNGTVFVYSIEPYTQLSLMTIHRYAGRKAIQRH